MSLFAARVITWMMNQTVWKTMMVFAKASGLVLDKIERVEMRGRRWMMSASRMSWSWLAVG